jgi:hypothetical protein
MPGIGVWKKWSPNQIAKTTKKRIFEKPNLTVSNHTEPTKSWKMALLESQGTFILDFANDIIILLAKYFTNYLVIERNNESV